MKLVAIMFAPTLATLANRPLTANIFVKSAGGPFHEFASCCSCRGHEAEGRRFPRALQDAYALDWDLFQRDGVLECGVQRRLFPPPYVGSYIRLHSLRASASRWQWIKVKGLAARAGFMRHLRSHYHYEISHDCSRGRIGCGRFRAWRG
jgi:hypothetical protein